MLPVSTIKDFIPEIIKSGTIDKIDISRGDYLKTGLGDFYESILTDKKVKSKKFKAPSGTLNNLYKNKLCDFVINSNYTYSDLIKDNSHLDKLITDLYNFIKSK